MSSEPPRPLYRALSFLTDLLVPQDCCVCGRESAGALVCEHCREALPLQPSAGCPRCAVPTTDGALCGSCLSEPPAFDATLTAFSYAFPVDRMVQALKYRYRLAVAAYFTDKLAKLGRPSDIDVILPVPLHVQRLRERGFNQAVEIARPLARAWGVPLELACVQRVSHLAPQASLTWKQRKDSMRGAFRCGKRLDGQTVLLVDDVMTTGATLDALARTVKAHGARRVVNLVVARTPPPA